MNFSLIICTYKREKAIIDLLESVQLQTMYPSEILVIDGSPDENTDNAVSDKKYQNLKYYKVPPEHLGLTKQRNFGIERVHSSSEVVCFLDDDTILSPTYFEEILKSYAQHPEALGVGGYIDNEIQWKAVGTNYQPQMHEFYFDGFVRPDGKRFVLRKKLNLDSNCPPGFSPLYSHGRSVGFLPPSKKIYPTEQLMGGVSSFKSSILKEHKFSTYFQGYGLYEDAEYTIRISKLGKLYVNTAATLGHFHDAAGRPNQFNYGKMVVRNGYVIWKTKNPNPKLIDVLKWHAITLLLTAIRASNALSGKDRQKAFAETKGRLSGWFSLMFNKPVF